LLKSSIPIRTFADWQENQPGFLEVDLVAHCGESSEGFYLTTLSTVDVASGWSECVGVWGKGQERVSAAVHQVRQRLPPFKPRQAEMAYRSDPGYLVPILCRWLRAQLRSKRQTQHRHLTACVGSHRALCQSQGSPS
jgi:hypothetical protein